MPENLLRMIFFPETRQDKEEKVMNLAKAAGFIDIVPKVKTHLGQIDAISNKGQLIQTVGKDWTIKGIIKDLDDEEFERLFMGVQAFAEKIMEYANANEE